MDLSTLSISEIKKLVVGSEKDNQELMLAMSADKRSGVRDIARRLRRANAVMLAEVNRLEKMFVYEDNLRASGYYPVAGVDEAGRGPLAGPVAAAAVILPREVWLPGLNDSKKLTPGKREALAIQIKDVALAFAVGLSSVEEIYQENIYHASLIAMRRAVLQLTIKPAYVLVDGFRIEQLELPQKPLVGGDGLSASIAAASIVAKVYRDHLMENYHELYPEYGFNKHKGYATPEHLRALASYGPCPIHRAGYQPVKIYIRAQESVGTA
ncbi:MAG: ribonuclease HII [Desulfotomaculaceae bacterium]|nr:ribonuclease HII [Desulfotomaculaceae bacterium]